MVSALSDGGLIGQEGGHGNVRVGNSASLLGWVGQGAFGAARAFRMAQAAMVRQPAGRDLAKDRADARVRRWPAASLVYRNAGGPPTSPARGVEARGRGGLSGCSA